MTFNLNKMEIEILKLLVNGRQDIDIAHSMAVSIRSIELRVANILKKLDAKSKTEAVIKAIKYSII